MSLLVATVQVTASGDTALVAAPGAGKRIVPIRVEASNSHATTALIFSLKMAGINSGSVFNRNYLAAVGGRVTLDFPGKIGGTANSALNANLSAAGQVEVTVYYKIERVV